MKGVSLKIISLKKSQGVALLVNVALLENYALVFDVCHCGGELRCGIWTQDMCSELHHFPLSVG